MKQVVLNCILISCVLVFHQVVYGWSSSSWFSTVWLPSKCWKFVSYFLWKPNHHPVLIDPSREIVLLLDDFISYICDYCVVVSMKTA